MSHYSVLILGKKPELQLYPYAELDGSNGPPRADWRAEFLPEVRAADFAAAARELVAAAEAKGDQDAPRLTELLAAGKYQELFRSWYGGELGPDGDWGHYVNPDAKWDWFMLGGRFSGKLRLLPGRTGVCGENAYTEDGRPEDPEGFDQARFADIDWAATRQGFTPFAVLKDGIWHAQGEMGWFGAVAGQKADAAWEAEVDALLAGLPPEALVSVYDCHI